MSTIRSPLHDWLAARGARIEALDGIEQAVDFGDPADEVHAARRDAVLIDLSARGKIAVTGDRARALLHGQVTNDIAALDPGAGCYAAHLTPKGRMITDLIIRCDEPDRVIIDLPRGMLATMVPKLARFAMLDDCEVADVSDDFALLLVAGPGARGALGPLVGPECVLELPAYHHVAGSIAGAPVRIVANADTGERGYVIWVEAARAAPVADAILAAGGVVPAGAEAYDILLIEAGCPTWGRDMTEANLPPECNIPHAISYTKGCYVGQETVARIKTYGQVNKELRGLSSLSLLPPGATLHRPDGKDVGAVTSSVHSPTLGRPIALGYVHRSSLDEGTHLIARDGERPIEVEVVPLPWVERRAWPEVS